MSSHHFVRENQEPPLLIVDVTGIPRPVVDELLEWCPQVWVCQQALEDILRWDVKIDVALVIEEARGYWLRALQHQAPVKIFTHRADEPPWVTAFYLLSSLNLQAVNVIGADPCKLTPIPEALGVCCIHQGVRWVYVRSGVFEKWMPAGVPVYFLGKQVMAFGLSAEGLTQQDGTVRLTAPEPFWVGEALAMPFVP